MVVVIMDGVIILHLMVVVMAVVVAHNGITIRVLTVAITRAAAVAQVTIHQKTMVVEAAVDTVSSA